MRGRCAVNSEGRTGSPFVSAPIHPGAIHMVTYTSRRRFVLAVLFGCAATVQLSATQLRATVIPPNLPPGSPYQLLFVTADGQVGTSSNLAVYDAFVSQ